MTNEDPFRTPSPRTPPRSGETEGSPQTPDCLKTAYSAASPNPFQTPPDRMGSTYSETPTTNDSRETRSESPDLVRAQVPEDPFTTPERPKASTARRGSDAEADDYDDLMDDVMDEYFRVRRRKEPPSPTKVRGRDAGGGTTTTSSISTAAKTDNDDLRNAVIDDYFAPSQRSPRLSLKTADDYEKYRARPPPPMTPHRETPLQAIKEKEDERRNRFMR